MEEPSRAAPCEHGDSPPSVYPTANGVPSGGSIASKLSPELVAKIAASKEVAKKRKAARIDALKRVFPLDGCQASDGKKDRAPDTAPHGGGRPMISNRRYAETKRAGTASIDGPAWPNDGSLATNETSHRSLAYSPSIP